MCVCFCLSPLTRGTVRYDSSFTTDNNHSRLGHDSNFVMGDSNPCDLNLLSSWRSSPESITDVTVMVPEEFLPVFVSKTPKLFNRNQYYCIPTSYRPSMGTALQCAESSRTTHFFLTFSIGPLALYDNTWFFWAASATEESCWNSHQQNCCESANKTFKVV